MPEYDTILLLSTTKWIHLNFGDEGIKRVFKRIHAQNKHMRKQHKKRRTSNGETTRQEEPKHDQTKKTKQQGETNKKRVSRGRQGTKVKEEAIVTNTNR